MVVGSEQVITSRLSPWSSISYCVGWTCMGFSFELYPFSFYFIPLLNPLCGGDFVIFSTFVPLVFDAPSFLLLMKYFFIS